MPSAGFQQSDHLRYTKIDSQYLSSNPHLVTADYEDTV
jgi:hypothetical protein